MGNEFKKSKLAERIRELRKSKNLTQETLCENANIEIPNYSNIETGKFVPSLQSLYKIVNALGVSYDEVMEQSHLEDENTIDDKIMEMYNKLSLKEKRRLYKIMRAMQEDF